MERPANRDARGVVALDRSIDVLQHLVMCDVGILGGMVDVDWVDVKSDCKCRPVVELARFEALDLPAAAYLIRAWTNIPTPHPSSWGPKRKTGKKRDFLLVLYSVRT